MQLWEMDVPLAGERENGWNIRILLKLPGIISQLEIKLCSTTSTWRTSRSTRNCTGWINSTCSTTSTPRIHRMNISTITYSQVGLRFEGFWVDTTHLLACNSLCAGHFVPKLAAAHPNSEVLVQTIAMRAPRITFGWLKRFATILLVEF
jgi:hypothetical protein